MKRIALLAPLAVAGLAVAGLAGALWIGASGRPAREPASPAMSGAADVAEAERVELVRAAPVPAPEPPEPAVAEAASERGRSAARDERPRIAGWIVVEGGFPARERVTVAAEVHVGREDDGRTIDLQAEVARDGSFELRVPSSAREAVLVVEAELLHQPEPVSALPGASDVVLEAVYLAEVHGRVLPPLGTDAGEMRRTRLECRPAQGTAASPSAQSWPYRLRPEDDGSYRLIALPTDIALELEVDQPWGPDWKGRIDPLAPGERRELVIALDTGVTVAGRVVDEHGTPLAGAHVSIRPPSTGRVRVVAFDGSTGDDGAFTAKQLPREVYEVDVRSDGLRSATLVVDATAGDSRDIVLVVERRGCVAGTVEWPDGRPVRSFMLTVEQPGSWVVSDHDHEDGAFEQWGVGEGSCGLRVQARDEGVSGEARLEGVESGQRDLRIVLETRHVFTLRGTAVDADGEPVERFRVRATGPGGVPHSASGRRGSFTLEGLAAGEWDVQVESDEHLETEPRRVRLGPDREPLRFVLERCGRIRGTVVDPAGRTVAAEVRVTGTGARRFERREFSTDAEGGFDLGASRSPLILQATCAGYAASEPHELAFAPGDGVEGVVLRLRAPCRLEGRVLDADGRPVVAAYVGVSQANDAREAQTDGRGAFAIEDLPPGPVQAFVIGDEDLLLRQRIELSSGTTSIELRIAAPDPVLVRGTIAQGGRPVACGLSFFGPHGWGRAESGPDGAFEVTLRNPGAWSVAVFGVEAVEAGPFHLAELVVPDAESHTLALDLDAMRVLQSPEELGY